ncbi:MAG TPA: tyrosine--tRNA ligase [Afifellaceae bacterium]|nr:tyrosine--tRNA ligase [Afifellaceae bacterium]
MSQFKSDFLRVLSERGFVHQMSDAEGLDALCTSSICPGYIGFDCTAPSLHAGSLVQIMLLYWLQQAGHKPIALMGGGTTRVGDPTGKDETRKMLSAEDIEHNKDGIRSVFERFLTFGDGSTDAIMADNADWLLELNYIEFLREIGRHLSVNQMLQRDAVKLRLEREQHLSFLEFNYMVLQAYDFVELNRRFGCRLQMGGSDQWGNIVAGIDLGRRVEQADLFAVTTPLLATTSGAKMGKTADGAVWLNADMLSPFQYWQYWRNTEDADVGRFLKLFTILPLDEITRLEGLQGSEINEAKKILATEATALLHGRKAADEASETARQTFEEGMTGDALPSIEISRAQIEEGIGLLPAFVQAGLAASNGEVRRQVRGKAIRVNDEIIDDETLTLTSDHLNDDGLIKLSVGRKRHALLKIAAG